MTGSVPTPEAFTESFPVPTLARISGEPDCQTPDKLKKQLIRNATSAKSVLGGGLHGHMGLLLSATACAVQTATPFLTSCSPKHAQKSTTMEIWSCRHHGIQRHDFGTLTWLPLQIPPQSNFRHTTKPTTSSQLPTLKNCWSGCTNPCAVPPSQRCAKQ